MVETAGRRYVLTLPRTLSFISLVSRSLKLVSQHLLAGPPCRLRVGRPGIQIQLLNLFDL